MALDRTTEAIAHFIGVFQINVEEIRLRFEYDAFRAAKTQQDDRIAQPFTEARSGAPLALKGFDPKVDHGPEPAAGLLKTAVAAPGAPRPDAPFAPTDLALPQASVPAVFGAGAGGGGGEPELFIPPPNSIVTLTEQVAALEDDDLLVFGGTADFLPADAHHAQFSALSALAKSLGAFGDDAPLAGQIPTAGDAMALAARVAAVQAPQTGGAQIAVLRGEAAQGVVTDGAAGDAMPVFADLLPAFLAAAEAEDADGDGETGLLPQDGTTDAAPSPFAVDPGHNVVTGANLAANEALITAKWIDAPVIAVAGDIVRIDAISQVNVLIDADTMQGALPAGAPDAPSQAVNAASIIEETSAGDDAPAPEGKPGLPQFWDITHVAGDVVLMNWVTQHSFLSDNDRVEITFTGSATHIGTGANTLTNLTNIVELGFHYDLILVGGDMVTLNLVNQTNILFDSDIITGAAPQDVAISSNGNVQLNAAELKTTGKDSALAMKDSFKTALDDMAAGEKDLAKAVAQDALFEGKAYLKALSIEGNLIKMNVVEQVNYIGDGDQVHLALDAFTASAGASVSITTGSNAQLNNAAIHDVGIDSQLMAGGEVYSDALIYQAQLVDTDAAPTGVGLAALATEAVAFLADGMIDATAQDEAAGMPAAPDHPGSVDLLQTMLA